MQPVFITLGLQLSRMAHCTMKVSMRSTISTVLVARVPVGCRSLYSRPSSLAAAGQLQKQQLPAQVQQQKCRHMSISAARRFVVCSASASETVELEVRVEGMKCGGCSSRVEEALKGMAQVKAVQVDLDTKLAKVQVEAKSLADAKDMLPTFVTTIKDLGFEAEPVNH